MSLIRQAPRLYDTKPWTAHLYLTDQCNLDCHYCNEYDNSLPHPDTDDLKKYLDKIRELGCLRIGFQGGEPLMHPDVVELVRTPVTGVIGAHMGPGAWGIFYQSVRDDDPLLEAR